MDISEPNTDISDHTHGMCNMTDNFLPKEIYDNFEAITLEYYSNFRTRVLESLTRSDLEIRERS